LAFNLLPSNLAGLASVCESVSSGVSQLSSQNQHPNSSGGKGELLALDFQKGKAPVRVTVGGFWDRWQAHSHRGAGGKNKTATPLPSCLEEPVKRGRSLMSTLPLPSV